MDFEERFIGNKIKKISKIFYRTVEISIIIIGITLLIIGISLLSYGVDNMGLAIVILDVIIVALGAFFSWIIHILIFGFGQLIDINEKNYVLLKTIALSKEE